MQTLYLMGRGHNGSTILNLILGAHGQITAAGEVSSGMRALGDACSCGKPLRECPFWGPTIDSLEEKFPDAKDGGYQKMIRYVDSFTRVPQTLLGFALPGWVKQRYQPMTEHLFEEISKHGQTDHVIDSSKEFGRGAFMLKFMPNAKVVYLARDGRGVLYSYLKRHQKLGTFHFMKRKRPLKSAWPIMLITALGLSFGTFLGHLYKLLFPSRVLILKYEEVCYEPHKAMKRIGDFIGLDLTELADRMQASQPMEIGHDIAGNQIRAGKIDFVFRPDEGWRGKLPASYRWIYWIFGMPHALLHGYYFTSGKAPADSDKQEDKS